VGEQDKDLLCPGLLSPDQPVIHTYDRVLKSLFPSFHERCDQHEQGIENLEDNPA